MGCNPTQHGNVAHFPAAPCALAPGPGTIFLPDCSRALIQWKRRDYAISVDQAPRGGEGFSGASRLCLGLGKRITASAKNLTKIFLLTFIFALKT